MTVRHTTIRLEQDGDDWRATQQDVDLVGRGGTAAEATANYARLVADTNKPVAADGGEDSE